jgi:uncharacterized protein (TIGR00661 family)
MMENRNILICPLDWGLGHVTRMIALARTLQDKGFNIIFGSGRKQQALLSSELKNVSFISFPGFCPSYSKVLPAWLVMLFRTPSLIYHIAREHRHLKSVIRENKIDIVISDNRFGLWNKNVISVYVTHQLKIRFPRPFRFAEPLGVRLQRAVIRKFDLCFIPDLPGEINLSGLLSHGLRLPENAIFTGILSRFNDLVADTGEFAYQHHSVILSGPEPQKSIMKDKLVERLSSFCTRVALLGAYRCLKPAGDENKLFTFYDSLNGAQLKGALESSECIIARAGYTSIMELVSLGRSAILIPTPGQTEQEYLAEYLESKGWFRRVSQMNIDTIIPRRIEAQFDKTEIVSRSRELLSNALARLSEYKKA